jgi:hypothetical protein
MADEDNMLSTWKHFAGSFRFGKGLLGRSSIALVALMGLGLAAICRLRSDLQIIAVFAVCALIFLIWYFRVERFANKNPLEALLEGGEYTAHHQMLLAAKGLPAITSGPGLQSAADAAMMASTTTNDVEKS